MESRGDGESEPYRRVSSEPKTSKAIWRLLEAAESAKESELEAVLYTLASGLQMSKMEFFIDGICDSGLGERFWERVARLYEKAPFGYGKLYLNWIVGMWCEEIREMQAEEDDPVCMPIPGICDWVKQRDDEIADQDIERFLLQEMVRDHHQALRFANMFCIDRSEVWEHCFDRFYTKTEQEIGIFSQLLAHSTQEQARRLEQCLLQTGLARLEKFPENFDDYGLLSIMGLYSRHGDLPGFTQIAAFVWKHLKNKKLFGIHLHPCYHEEQQRFMAGWAEKEA